MRDGGGAPENWAFGGDGGDGGGMSATVPTDPAAILEFATPHAPVWVARAGQIGSTPEETAAVADALAAAAQAQRDAFAARSAAEAATQAYYNAAAVLREAAARVVRNAHNLARSTNNPEVFSLAEIPPPRTRRRSLPPPNAPERLRARLLNDGALVLVWNASQPRGMSGVVYEVRRRLPHSPTPTVIGATGDKSFTDATLPAGQGGAEYTVTTLRGSQRSAPSVLAVRLGVQGQGMQDRQAA